MNYSIGSLNNHFDLAVKQNFKQKTLANSYNIADRQQHSGL